MPQVPLVRWHSTQARAVGRVVCIWWWTMLIPERPSRVTGMAWSRIRLPSASSTVPMVENPVM